MNEYNAASYFELLDEYLRKTEITDNAGASHTLNEGCQRAIDMILAGGISGKIMVVGNGGSAAIASHTHNDLAKMVGVKSMVFTEVPLLTALTNDIDYIEAYERQIEMWANPSDVLIAISSSGKSENILRAVRCATAKGCSVITFSGFQPTNPLRSIGALNFYVPSDAYGFVELSHGALIHYLTDTASIQRPHYQAQTLDSKV